MNKNFYLFANILLGLTFASGLWQSLLRFRFNAQVFQLESFPQWFLVISIVLLISELFLLKYFHFEKYWFSFVAGSIATLATFCQYTAFYILIISRQLESYYILSVLIALISGILYALSLMVSVARTKPWLQRAGIYMLLIGLVSLATLLWGMPFRDAQHIGLFEKISQWISLAGSFVPLFFIKQFSVENKQLKEDNTQTSLQKYSEKGLAIGVLIAAGCTLTFGIILTNESFTSEYWARWNFEKTKQLAQLFEARIYVSSRGDTLHYRLLKPFNYNPNKKYPLVISLPYGGQPGTDKIRQIEGAAAAELLSDEENRKKYPAFLFVPHCPPGSGWGGIPYYPSVDSLVYEALTDLEKEPGIDTKRRYVTGISRGGYGSWHFICTRPDMFAAAIPVCGAGDPRLAPNMVNVAVWAFHGKKDRNVPVSGSRDMVEAVRRAGGNPRYTEFSHAGHNIWYQVTQTPGLLDWLFAQKQD